VAKDQIGETVIAVFKGCVSVQRLSNTQKKEKNVNGSLNWQIVII
jgi:hypothetical protein